MAQVSRPVHRCRYCGHVFQRLYGLTYHVQHNVCLPKKHSISSTLPDTKQTIHCSFCQGKLKLSENGLSVEEQLSCHFKRKCPSRRIWQMERVLTVSLLDFWLLGMARRPKSAREFGRWLLEKPRWSSSMQRVVHDQISRPQEIVARWKRLVSWDHDHRMDVSWCTSGHPCTRQSVRCLLDIPKDKQKLWQVTDYLRVNLTRAGGTADVRQMDVAALAWQSRADSWSKLLCHDQSVWGTLLNKQSTSSSAPANVSWMAGLDMPEILVRYTNLIGDSSLAVSTAASIRSPLSHIAVVRIATQKLQVATEALSFRSLGESLQTEWLSPNHMAFHSLAMAPLLSSDVHDRLSLELLYDDSNVAFEASIDVARLSRSFQQAAWSFVRDYGNVSDSNPSLPIISIQILVSDCKRYRLFQTRCACIQWSVATQYRFLVWWLSCDHYLRRLLSKSNPIPIRLHVPYLIGSPDSLCPFCVRLETTKLHRHWSCRLHVEKVDSTTTVVKSDLKVDQPSTANHTDRHLGFFSIREWCSRDLFPLLMEWQRQTFLSRNVPMTNSLHTKTKRDHRQRLYTSEQRVQSVLKRFETLVCSGINQFPSSWIFPCQADHIEQPTTIDRDVSASTTRHRHDWSLCQVHSLLSQPSNIIATVFRLYCVTHRQTIIAWVDHIFGYLLLYNYEHWPLNLHESWLPFAICPLTVPDFLLLVANMDSTSDTTVPGLYQPTS